MSKPFDACAPYHQSIDAAQPTLPFVSSPQGYSLVGQAPNSPSGSEIQDASCILHGRRWTSVQIAALQREVHLMVVLLDSEKEIRDVWEQRIHSWYRILPSSTRNGLHGLKEAKLFMSHMQFIEKSVA